uniref:Aminopeptidase n=1 Tax=Oryzias sinensis TaxID=183150 RepID=A0A8C8E1X1_9TELE
MAFFCVFAESANLPRNMIENSMFEEEPDVVDLTFPALDPDEITYEPRSSRLLVRGLGENDMDEDEEDCESSARLLGMSFMNRSSSHRPSSSPYTRQSPSRSCSRPTARTMVACVLFLVIVASMTMVLYFLPGCTFTKDGCPKRNKTTPLELVYPLATNGELFPWTQLRLPQSVHPLSYELTLTPDLDNMTFAGIAVINMSVLHNTNRIVLHGLNLNISNATFKYKANQQIAVKFTEYLKVGQYCVLTLTYSANLSSTYDGFYSSSYTDKSGTKHILAATQFEPLSARKAFPCFDEPAFKATFLIKINRKQNYTTLSNMPQDEFERTSVNMSTYLVAFVVANFSPISKNVSGTLVSVYSVPEKKEHTEYALEAASKLLEFYNTFFDIDYPLKKLDLVAIPDFLAGAMENWGLITFRETTLLVGKDSSPLEKQVVASVVAHELAHQVENLFLSVRFRVMDKDALISSHPVSTAVVTPEQVEEMFDSVSYEKGASILLMLNAYLPGEQQFRKGIIQYLKQFSGSNTETNNLWDSLTQVSTPHQNVSEMMSSWTSLKGFPLVSVSRKGDEVTLTQEHFLLTPANASHTSSLWEIPVTYVNDSCSVGPECRQNFLLKAKSGTFKVPESVKWLKLNYQNTGYYIVDYGDDGWTALINALSTNVSILTFEDRASLIHNMFALSRQGRVSFRRVLSLLNYTYKETETAPVTEALLQLNNIYRLLEKRQEFDLMSCMKTYILDHFGALMDNQTWGEEENLSKQELRSALLSMACSLEKENCTQSANDMFKQYVSNQTRRIPGDLQQVVFSVAAQSRTDWLILYDMYKQSTVDAEKRNMLLGLASTQDTQILNEGLKGDVIQTQELPLIINTVSRGFAGYLFAWDFVQVNWDRLIEKFLVGSFAIQSIIKSVTSPFSTQAHLDQVKAFFSSLQERGSQMRSVQEALETIRLNQLWMERNLSTLRELLTKIQSQPQKEEPGVSH